MRTRVFVPVALVLAAGLAAVVAAVLATPSSRADSISTPAASSPRFRAPDDQVRGAADTRPRLRRAAPPRRAPELVDGTARALQPDAPDPTAIRSGLQFAFPISPGVMEEMSMHLRPYQPGDKVWTSEPPLDHVAITIDCPDGTVDAARKLVELDRERSPISEVDCRE